jgi:hypothetical protein
MQLFYPAILITLMFFLSGLEKIYTFSKTTRSFSNKINIPLTLSNLVISCVIILEIMAPLIITSYTFTGLFNLLPLFKIAVISLIAFTIAATMMYHNPFKSGKNYHAFISHLSIIGGLLALYMCV